MVSGYQKKRAKESKQIKTNEIGVKTMKFFSRSKKQKHIIIIIEIKSAGD